MVQISACNAQNYAQEPTDAFPESHIKVDDCSIRVFRSRVNNSGKSYNDDGSCFADLKSVIDYDMFLFGPLSGIGITF